MAGGKESPGRDPRHRFFLPRRNQGLSSADRRLPPGISARYSSIIWTSTARRGSKGSATPLPEESLLWSWNRYAAAGWPRGFPPKQRSSSTRTTAAAVPDGGLEWIWDHPEVILALSGMNDIAQVEDNAKAASERKPLTKKDLALFQAVRKEIDAVEKIHCTGCGYCQPCPQGVDIPNCFRSYNVRFSDGWFKGLKEYFMMTTLREKTIQCRAVRPMRQMQTPLPTSHRHPPGIGKSFPQTGRSPSTALPQEWQKNCTILKKFTFFSQSMI